MNIIEHTFEPQRLQLCWQRPLVENLPRTRHIVGLIDLASGEPVFRYLSDSEDYKQAQQEGFKGFTPFDPNLLNRAFRGAVLEPFIRRLPPRKRNDFGEYLAQHRLPENFSGSEIALLAYTGAKLPGDGFELIPDLSEVKPPVEIVVEAAGFRYQKIDIAHISLGDTVRLLAEEDNPHDPNAIAIMHTQGRIGYVPKPYCSGVAKWMSGYTIEAQIERLNGRPERPVVYLFLKTY